MIDWPATERSRSTCPVSDSPPDLAGPISLAALAQAVIDTLDVLEEQRPLHVMGNSLGGAVALQLLALQPQRVATLDSCE